MTVSRVTATFSTLLTRARDGDDEARAQLVQDVYHDLRVVAKAARRRGPDVLQTTALVNEAWMRLEKHGLAYGDRKHYLVVAARAMRQILVDEARALKRKKRGGDHLRISFHTLPDQTPSAESLLSLDQALDWLGERSQRLLNVFQLRYFVGLDEAEVADALDVSPRTVRREWLKAKAVLGAHLQI